MTSPRVITEELGGSSLARAAQRGEAPHWYRPRPIGGAAWRDYAEEVARPYASGAWLEALLPAFQPSGNAAPRLRRAAEGGGIVVSTGQQAALFGGPLYTLVKALSALAIADAIEREAGIPAAPVFWAATDDADFQEASCAKVVLDDEVHALCVRDPATSGVPMSAVPLGDPNALIATLARACGSMVDDAPLAAIRASHVVDVTLGDAYVRLLRMLLEPLGIAVLDASHPATRKAGAAVLERALTRAASIDAGLRARSEAIVAAGYAPQVELVDGLSLVFAADVGGAKRRLRIGERAATAKRADFAPLAPNVLLRPLVERSIMPAAAYVAGPGEIAYFAQVSAVGAALDVPAPLVLPRWSATILEPRIERLLERLGVRREELADPHAVESQFARQALPSEITTALDELRRDLAANVGALAAADSNRLIPRATLDGLERWIERRIGRVTRRYAAAMKRQDAQRMHDVATARAALYPEGKRQERVLNFIPFLARNGRPLLDAMRHEAARHAVALIGSPDSARALSGAAAVERV